VEIPETTLSALVAEQAAKTPDAPALLCGDVDIMLPGEYAQLAQINAALTQQIRQRHHLLAHFPIAEQVTR
ncbi:hypothetical protein ACUODJ_61980, partial [Escherichia sp. HC-CC]